MHVLQAHLLSNITLAPNSLLDVDTLRGIIASVSEHQASLLQSLEYINTSSEPDFLINLKQCGVECPCSSSTWGKSHALMSKTCCTTLTLGEGVLLSIVSLLRSVEK